MSEDEAIPTTLRAAPKAIIKEHANSPGNPMFPVRGTEPSASQSPQLYEDSATEDSPRREKPQGLAGTWILWFSSPLASDSADIPASYSSVRTNKSGVG